MPRHPWYVSRSREIKISQHRLPCQPFSRRQKPKNLGVATLVQAIMRLLRRDIWSSDLARLVMPMSSTFSFNPFKQNLRAAIKGASTTKRPWRKAILCRKFTLTMPELGITCQNPLQTKKKDENHLKKKPSRKGKGRKGKGRKGRNRLPKTPKKQRWPKRKKGKNSSRRGKYPNSKTKKP